jgi:hypothetical protein
MLLIVILIHYFPLFNIYNKIAGYIFIGKYESDGKVASGNTALVVVFANSCSIPLSNLILSSSIYNNFIQEQIVFA